MALSWVWEGEKKVIENSSENKVMNANGLHEWSLVLWYLFFLKAKRKIGMKRHEREKNNKKYQVFKIYQDYARGYRSMKKICEKPFWEQWYQKNFLL